MTNLCERCLVELSEDNHTLSNEDMCDNCQSSDWEKETKAMHREYERSKL